MEKRHIQTNIISEVFTMPTRPYQIRCLLTSRPDPLHPTLPTVTPGPLPPHSLHTHMQTHSAPATLTFVQFLECSKFIPITATLLSLFCDLEPSSISFQHSRLLLIYQISPQYYLLEKDFIKMTSIQLLLIPLSFILFIDHIPILHDLICLFTSLSLSTTQTCAVQHSIHWPHMAVQHLKSSQSYLRYVVG